MSAITVMEKASTLLIKRSKHAYALTCKYRMKPYVAICLLKLIADPTFEPRYCPDFDAEELLVVEPSRGPDLEIKPIRPYVPERVGYDPRS